jgi:multiple antibiotic resistance protein
MSPGHLILDFVTLCVTIDPVGTVPLFLALTASLSEPDRRRVAVRAILVSLGLLLGCIYFAQYLLEAMDVSLRSFQIAGGIVLFLFALSMVFKNPGAHAAAGEEGHDIAVFPLAMPAIAGPGSMLAAVVLTDNHRFNLMHQTGTALVLVVVLALTLGLLLAAVPLMRLLGKSGANVLSRVMGLLLASVAVNMVLAALNNAGI